MPQNTQGVELVPHACCADDHLALLVCCSHQLEQSQTRDGSRWKYGLNAESILLAPFHHDLFLHHSMLVADVYGRIYHVL